ncbi:MAG TPA: hypothetical protein DDW65_21065 [Firmicutes bacterium]|nr:hypothetical protein [Bacillota bacterium]
MNKNVSPFPSFSLQEFKKKELDKLFALVADYFFSPITRAMIMTRKKAMVTANTLLGRFSFRKKLNPINRPVRATPNITWGLPMAVTTNRIPIDNVAN